MSQWISSAELHLDSAFGQTIFFTSSSYAGAIAKRESAIFVRRIGELVGVRDRRDLHKGPRLIFVNPGTRRTKKVK